MLPECRFSSAHDDDAGTMGREEDGEGADDLSGENNDDNSDEVDE